MQPSPIRDLVVGIFVLIGLGTIGYLSVQVGGVSYKGPGGLTLYAAFDEVGGLKPRAPVSIAGVTVPYRRLQGLPDHELGMYVGAAVDMLAAASAAPERWYNGELVEGDLGDADARDRAVAGGLDGTSDEVAAEIEAALGR